MTAEREAPAGTAMREVGAEGEGGPFAALIGRLGREPGGAERAYEQLRIRLIAFFRLHDPAQSDDLADAALDRIARKLHEGVEVDNLRLYALAVARHVLLEAQSRGRRERRLSNDPGLRPDPDAAGETERLERALAALRACVDALDRRSADLILAYYGDDGAARIRARQRLADELGTSLNALRNRALRLREALERCVRRRLPEGEGP